MLRSNAVQDNSYKNRNFNPVFPGRYIYFDNYFKRLFNTKKPLSLIMNLFDGRVSLTIDTSSRFIQIKGERELSDEIYRHILQFPPVREYSIEVLR